MDSPRTAAVCCSSGGACPGTFTQLAWVVGSLLADGGCELVYEGLSVGVVGGRPFEADTSAIHPLYRVDSEDYLS